MNIAPVGEPVPQDFLGEADLPYPSPTTQQERQARQRKRAEQLRQLKLHEEREAKENWSRLRPETIQPSSSSSSSSMSWTVRKPLQRSPSSPSKVGDHSSSSSSSSLKKNGSTKLRVRFDMKANEIIEFEVEEEYDSRSKPSSPGFAPPNFRLSSGRTAYEIGGN
ncbi:hypothetical protein BGZ76_004453 [Entomortierella beljakovae]|nr:hypothetical protein BGZ76_004453 [Entomortierella beljakovae]